MSHRIVMELTELEQAPVDGQPAAPHTVLLKVREPGGRRGVWPFTCTGHEEVFAALRSAAPETDVVTAAGRQLFDAVTTPDPVRDLVVAALAVQEPDRWPIYLDLSDAKESHALPWEALCTTTGQFLALDPCWPVARMLDGTRKAVVERTLGPPLRLAAILSCLRIEAREEWDALRKAIETSGAPIRVLLLVSETDLHDQIARLELPWLQLGMVPVEYRELQDLITDFEPHLLHFFCHGLATGGAHLEIATAPDWLGNMDVSRHRLEARPIRELVRSPKDAPWAIVLNACSTAATTDEAIGTHSLASTLVSEYGVPAVIGMREPVLSSDAARFTGAFYTALLTDLRARIDARARGVAIDWASYTVGARADLCHDRDVMFDVAAARYKAWTLPVVAVSRDQFTIDIVDAVPMEPAAQEQARRAAEIADSMLAALPPGTPPETRAALERLLGKQTLGPGGRR